MNTKGKIYTKNEEVEAFVWQVFIDQNFLFSMRATSQEPNQVPVLKLCYELNFIFELYETLS
jgi:hypothetical protein